MEGMEPRKVATFDKDLEAGAGAIDAETLAAADVILNKYEDELELEYRIPTPQETEDAETTPVVSSVRTPSIQNTQAPQVPQTGDLYLRAARELKNKPVANDEGGFFSKVRGLFGGR